jgi:predicted transposase YdaD
LHKPFDITTKQIVDTNPLAWVHFLGLPGISAELVDTDIAVTAQADRLIRWSSSDDQSLLHLELQASYHKEKVEDALFYNVCAKRTLRLPCESVIILLRKEADGPAMSGVLEDKSTTFRFNVVRVWEIAPEVFLNGPVSMLPLAVVADSTQDELPLIIVAVANRIDSEVPEMEQGTTWLEVRLLLGLKYDRSVARAVLAGVRRMRESTTYMEILEEGIAEGEARGIAEGEAKGERRLLTIAGTKRFGEPDDVTRAMIDSLDTTQIEALMVRIFEVESWEELLAE